MSLRERLGQWLLKTIDIDGGLRSSWDSVDWSTDNYLSLSKEGYEHCATVYRCIDVIAKPASSVLFGVFQEEDDGLEIVPKHPFIELLKRPNPLMGRSAMLKYWAMSFLLGGEAFLFGNVLESSGELCEIWPIPNYQIEPVWSTTTYGEISHFTWSNDIETRNLSTEQVLYCWLPNPRDFRNPMSPLKAAAQEVDIQNDGLKWNLSLLRSSVKSPFYVGLDSKSEMTLSDTHVTDIKRSLKTEYAGASNAGRVPILKIPGLMMKSYGWNPHDLDWLNALDKTDVRIANVFAVPPELIGAQKTYENFEVAQRVLYTNAILPLLEYLADELSNWKIVGLIENELIDIRRERIKALQEDQDDIAKRASELVDRGIITRNEARRDLKYSLSDDPMADVLTVTKEVATLGAAPFNIGTETIDADGE